MELSIALHVDPKDNVATIFANGIQALQTVEVRDKSGKSRQIQVNQDIPYGHKIAVTQILPGQSILKYGEAIGIASQVIAVGDHVHIHNLDSARGRGDLG